MYGGIFVEKQLNNLQKRNIKFTVIHPILVPIHKLLSFKNNTKLHTVENDKDIFRPIYFHIPFKLLNFVSIILYKNAVSKIVKKYKLKNIDIIHAHWSLPSGYAAVRLGKYLKLPVVCTVRGSDINKYSKYNLINSLMTRYVFKNTDQIITVSRKMLDSISSYRTKSKPICIYNGVDTTSFYPKSRSEKTVKNRLLFVGTIDEDKGIFDLISACNILAQNLIDVTLTIIGSGKDVQRLEDTIKKGVEFDISYIGPIKNNELSKWYNMNDLVVLPSYHEGLPNVLVEAISCGVPIVGSNVGGIPEIVSHKVGFTHEPGDVVGLFGCIKSILTDSDLYNEMSKKCLEVSSEIFNDIRSTTDIFTVYSKLNERMMNNE